MHVVRDFFRRRRLARHVEAHGWVFPYEGCPITVPRQVDLAVTNALIKGTYESSEIRLIRAHLPSDRAVIELGGSLGVVSAVIEQVLDPGIQHLVVEANPDLLDICTKNASAAGSHKGLTVEGCAVFYGAPEVTLQISKNPHSGMVDAKGESTDQIYVTVPARTLADLHAQMGSPSGYSLICDIESAELPMVLNDQETLKRADLIIMELHPHLMPKDAPDIPEILARLGFGIVAEEDNVIAWRKTDA